jgi:hypothetical protein
MAVRKLSLSLFAAKPEVTQYEHSPQRFHFIGGARNKPRQYALVCETQPLLTLTGCGFPTRCPFCGQENPIGRDS